MNPTTTGNAQVFINGVEIPEFAERTAPPKPLPPMVYSCTIDMPIAEDDRRILMAYFDRLAHMAPEREYERWLRALARRCFYGGRKAASARRRLRTHGRSAIKIKPDGHVIAVNIYLQREIKT